MQLRVISLPLNVQFHPYLCIPPRLLSELGVMFVALYILHA
jgi:hypothetical protein